MFTISKDDVFVGASVHKATCIVNPVNTYGRMGAGLAKEIGELWPRYKERHVKLCKRGALRPGSVMLYPVIDETESPGARRFPHVTHVLDAATKDHWSSASTYDRISCIAIELARLAARPDKHKALRVVALPALGCGLGGLELARVQAILEDALANTPEDLHFILFANANRK